MTTKLGTIKNAATGEILVEMIGPPSALSNDDALSSGLYALSEYVIRGVMPSEGFSGLGGRFGYGAEFENEVFSMFPDYQDCACEDEENHQPDCNFGRPNFVHKPSGLTVNWYKWIGRSMDVSNPDLTVGEWQDILKACVESLPAEARAKAEAESKADAEREADPEFQRQREAHFAAMLQAISDIHDQCEREGHDDATGHCKRCGLVTDFERDLASTRGEASM